MHYKEYKTILSNTNGINIYRGCTHGCIYCDSRSECYKMEHDFEDIEVKLNASEILDSELKRRRKRCVIATGSMSDPYMHCEAELLYTQKCLQTIERNGFGVSVLTKSTLYLRDIDLLAQINKNAKCVMQVTLTTYSDQLCRIVEPRVAVTSERFKALCTLSERGIPAVVWMTPILPFINDTEENIRGLVKMCAEAGVVGIISFGLGLTLRDGDRDYYYNKLDEHFPGLKSRYIRQYGNAYSLSSTNSAALCAAFYEECGKHGIMTEENRIFDYIRRFEEPLTANQMTLF